MGCSLEVYRCRIGQFVSALQKILTRRAKIAALRIRGLKLKTFAGKVAVACLLTMLLIGGIEPNPGPSPTKEDKSTLGMEASQLLQGLTDTVHCLTGAIHRLEEGQRQLSESLNGKLSDIQTTLHAKLQQLGEEQEILRLDMDEVVKRQERVEDDTSALKESMQQLTSKLEWLEMDRRKSNLLFFGIPKQKGVTCEQMIKTVLQQQLKITADIMVEYAYWTGDAILVRFQTLKQRAMVLAQARHLTADSKLSIREDYPEAVRRRRSGLVGLYKQLRRDGKKATLKADKLHTADGVFGFDVERGLIVQLGPSPPRRPRNPVSMEVPHAATSAPVPNARMNDDAADQAMETEATDAGQGGGGGGPGVCHQLRHSGGRRDIQQGQQQRGDDSSTTLAVHTNTHTPACSGAQSSKN